MITRCDAYQKLCMCKYINPKCRQKQLKSSFIETLFESKNVKNITFHNLQQLVHICNQQAAVSRETLYFLCFSFKQSLNERSFQLSLPTFWIYIYIYQCLYVMLYMQIYNLNSQSVTHDLRNLKFQFLRVTLENK